MLAWDKLLDKRTILKDKNQITQLMRSVIAQEQQEGAKA